MPRLFMFKEPAGNGTTFEALEHNSALDADSWEKWELFKIQRRKAGQETLQKNDGELSPFPSFVLFGRLNPARIAQRTPSIAANSNKQECWLFLSLKRYERWKAPRWVTGHRGSFWGLKTSVSVPVHLWSFSVGHFCQHVVAGCHHSSASLGTTVLSSLHTHSCLFSWQQNRYKSQTRWLIYLWFYWMWHNISLQEQKETMLKFSSHCRNSTWQKTYNKKANPIIFLTFAKVQCNPHEGKCLWWAARNQNSTHSFCYSVNIDNAV